MSAPCIVRELGRQPYEPVWRAMQRFTDERTEQTPDEIWFLEHPPVYTLGMNASPSHVLAPGAAQRVRPHDPDIAGHEDQQPGQGQEQLHRWELHLCEGQQRKHQADEPESGV